MKDKITRLVENSREEIINLTQDLVSIHSETGNEGKIIERLESIMNDYGFDEVKIDAMGNLIGRIGSGKTTLLRALLGLVPNDSGEMYWNGEEITARSFQF